MAGSAVLSAVASATGAQQPAPEGKPSAGGAGGGGSGGSGAAAASTPRKTGDAGGAAAAPAPSKGGALRRIACSARSACLLIAHASRFICAHALTRDARAAAILRQLEEENMRLRASMSGAGAPAAS